MISGGSASSFGGLSDRAEACFLGAFLGDSMGTCTEGLSYEQIEERYRWVDRFDEGASGTDDSFVKEMLAQALVDTDGEARAWDWGQEWVRSAAKILSPPLRRKFFISILQTTYKLKLGLDPAVAADGNLPSSTAAMSIAPVGIVNAGNPRAAALQAWELASLLHPPECAFCREGAAIIAAVIAEALAGERDLRGCIDVGTGSLWCGREGGEVANLITGALQVAEQATDFANFRSAYRETFVRDIQCDSRETVPAALAVAVLAGGNLEAAVVFAANFGRDTDTIGAMVGGVCGALGGNAALPTDWLARVDGAVVERQRTLARDLVVLGRAKAAREIRSWSRCGDHRA